MKKDKNSVMNETIEHSKNNDYQNFTLSLALFDALPVLFFSISMILIAMHFQNACFLTGAVFCSVAGCGKVLWKILLSARNKNFMLLNRQLRILMPTGFLLIILGLILGRTSIHPELLIKSILGFPSVIFFSITVAGMICMTIFAFTLDGTSAKANWMEQITNAVAQGCFLLGVIFL